MSLPTGLKISLRHNVKLSQYCTMQTGGMAADFAEPENENELLEILEGLRGEGRPFVILGKGSNVIFPDEGYQGVVISLLRFQSDQIIINKQTQTVVVAAGVHLYRFVTACRDAGLGGAEFLANIPGSVGGAIVMNAGFSRFNAQTNEIADILTEIQVMDYDGQIRIIQRDRVPFGYRKSKLENVIILKAKFQLWKRPQEQIQQEIDSNFKFRNTKQDLRYPSSGSIFKNPPMPHAKAAVLIEKAGLKGYRLGGAMISDRHCNYIVNVDHATSKDVTDLIEFVQNKISETEGILLEPEIRIIKNP